MRQPRLFYGWVVACASMVALLAAGGAYYGFGVFFKPLQAEFGWSYSLTSLVQVVFSLAYGVSLYFSGKLSDQHGPRPLFAGGAVLIALSFGLCSQVNSAVQLMGLYIVAGLGTGTIWATATSTVQRWFVARRGLAVAIASSGVGLGTLLFSPLLSYLIYTQGWRTTYLIFGVVAAALLASTIWFMSPRPEAKGLRPYGAPADAAPVAPAAAPLQHTGGPGLLETVKTRNFVLLSLAYLFAVLPITLVAVHLVPYAIQRQISATSAAGALGFVGAMSVPGRLMGGVVADRIGWKKSMVLFCLLGGAMLVWLVYAREIWMFYVFAIFYGLFYGARVPHLPGLVSYLFGTRSLGEMTGLVTGIGVGLGGLGALLAGFIVDISGGYTLAFVAAAVFFALGAAFTGLLKAPPADYTRH